MFAQLINATLPLFMKKGLFLCMVMAVMAVACSVSDKNRRTQTAAPVRYNDTTLLAEQAPYLMPYNRVIDGAGVSVSYGDPNLENHSLDLTMLPNSPLLAVEDSYGVAVFDSRSRKMLHRWTYDQNPDYKDCMSAFSGIKAVNIRDTTYLFWSVGGRSTRKSHVMQARWDGKEIRFVRSFVFDAIAPATIALPNDVAVLEENGAWVLYTVLNGNNQAAKVDIRSGKVLWTAPTGVAPFGLRVVGDRVFVTNWAGPVVNPSDGRSTAGVPWGAAYTDPRTDAIAQGTVSVLNKQNGQAVKDIAVGLHPNAIIASGQTLYVANGNSDYISVIDVGKMAVTDSIFVGLFAKEKYLTGSTPNALTLDESTGTLYVANGMDNAIAVVRLGSKPGKHAVQGYIPTQAYPGGVVFHNNELYVTNLEAIGARASHKLDGPAKADKAFNAHKQLASLSFIPVPDAAQLAIFTEKVKQQSLYQRAALSALLPRKNVAPRPVPERIGEPSVFKHVLYIIKENRTYDQVLGDMPQGRGMASLCIFGDSVTPNQHQLARDYSLLDNYHVSGKSSAEGHHWASAGIVTDYTEKSVRAWFRSYPHVLYDAMVYQKKGLIWNQALDQGKTARIYGEACTCEFDETTYNWTNLYEKWQKGESFPYKNVTTLGRVQPILAADFPGCDNEIISDQMRADAFLKELRAAEADPNGTLPNLMVMALPNDHTAGMNPKFPTPRAMVADNDLAVGRIVEAVMKSRFAASTVIFISEDDSQAGWDHISAYRTTGFVISQYSRLQKTVRTNYNQTSLLRTIEQILGIPPMNVIDATATPMFDCFTDKPDTTFRFAHRKNMIRLDEMNKPPQELKGQSQRYTRQSMDYAFHRIDRGDDDLLNRIIWFSAKGETPYPKLKER